MRRPRCARRPGRGAVLSAARALRAAVGVEPVRHSRLGNADVVIDNRNAQEPLGGSARPILGCSKYANPALRILAFTRTIRRRPQAASAAGDDGKARRAARLRRARSAFGRTRGCWRVRERVRAVPYRPGTVVVVHGRPATRGAALRPRSRRRRPPADDRAGRGRAVRRPRLQRARARQRRRRSSPDSPDRCPSAATAPRCALCLARVEADRLAARLAAGIGRASSPRATCAWWSTTRSPTTATPCASSRATRAAKSSSSRVYFSTGSGAVLAEEDAGAEPPDAARPVSVRVRRVAARGVPCARQAHPRPRARQRMRAVQSGRSPRAACCSSRSRCAPRSSAG